MTSQKLFFIRHGQLVPPYLNHLTMDFKTLADLSTSTLNPGINKNAPELFSRQTEGVDFSNVQLIYYNNSGFQSQRSLESAQLIQRLLQQKFSRNIQLVGLPELREVRFDVQRLMSYDDFKQNGMAALRSALYKEQVSGAGYSESLDEIEKRIERIVSVIRQQKDGDVISVTHDFFMRVIEIYITRSKRLVGATVEDLERTGLNYYFGGFETDQGIRAFHRWGKLI